jgi:hypothetical protein
VILAKDLHWSPKPFQPLYFGEHGNNDQNILNDWVSAPNRQLFAATLALPFSTSTQRCVLRNELVRAYNPIFQSEGARMSTRELGRKLDAIEVRQYEQNLHIIALLQQLNRIFEQQPVPPRRPIGFLAQMPGSDSAETTDAASY